MANVDRLREMGANALHLRHTALRSWRAKDPRGRDDGGGGGADDSKSPKSVKGGGARARRRMRRAAERGEDVEEGDGGNL